MEARQADRSEGTPAETIAWYGGAVILIPVAAFICGLFLCKHGATNGAGYGKALGAYAVWSALAVGLFVAASLGSLRYARRLAGSWRWRGWLVVAGVFAAGFAVPLFMMLDVGAGKRYKLVDNVDVAPEWMHRVLLPTGIVFIVLMIADRWRTLLDASTPRDTRIEAVRQDLWVVGIVLALAVVQVYALCELVRQCKFPGESAVISKRLALAAGIGFGLLAMVPYAALVTLIGPSRRGVGADQLWSRTREAARDIGGLLPVMTSLLVQFFA